MVCWSCGEAYNAEFVVCEKPECKMLKDGSCLMRWSRFERVFEDRSDNTREWPKNEVYDFVEEPLLGPGGKVVGQYRWNSQKAKWGPTEVADGA